MHPAGDAIPGGAVGEYVGRRRRLSLSDGEGVGGSINTGDAGISETDNVSFIPSPGNPFLGLGGGLYHDEAKRREVWRRTTTPARSALDLSGHSEWAIDALGASVRYSDYGDRSSAFGWELDHHPIPKALGGDDAIENLRALHWRSNVRHGNVLAQNSA